MSAMRNPIDSTALGWVKPELDALLHQARIEIEAWADAPADTSALATCAQLLQQLRGSLQMLDLAAPAALAEEMRQLALAVREDAGIADRDAAGAALMRGLVQLPDYLEFLQGGHRDVPVALQPLFDEIRAARGEPGIDPARLQAMGGAEPVTEAELAQARAALGGRNRALLDTVAGAVKEDLMQVKDALDLHLRGAQSEAAALQPQAEALGRIADTLAVIGLDGAAGRIAGQRDALGAIAGGDRPASEDALLDIAGTLLQVDVSLDEQVERMGSDASDDLSAGPARRATAALLHEAGNNLAHVREGVIASMQDGWRPESLAEVPRLLQEIGGALRMLEQPHPADLASGVQAYVQTELLGRDTAPDTQALDGLADAVTSLEMYLEAWGEGARREDLLDITRASLATLRYWPLPQAGVRSAFAVDTDEPADDAEPVAVAGDARPERGTETAAPIAETSAAPAPAPIANAGAIGFEQAGDEIDDEIRDVFLEEFEEEIGNLGELVPQWRREPDNLELLRPIRRVFHTLKGSGRLVGARLLGEFSWKIENMLNRVLDGSRPASPSVIALVEQAQRVLPQLHVALRGEGAVTADLAGLEQIAERLAAGEEVRIMPLQLAPASPAAVEPTPDTETATQAQAETLDDTAAETQPETPTPTGTPATVDPVLFEILDAEIAGHLQTIETWLQSGALQADESLLRALHTSYGAFAMTEVPVITETLGPAEGYAKRLLAAGQPASPEGVAAIAAVAATLRDTLAALRTEQPRLQPVPELVAQLQALRDALPEPAAPQLATAQADALDALGFMGDMPVPDAPLVEIEPLAATSVEALLYGHAGLGFDRSEFVASDAQRAEAEREAAQQSEAALLEAERVAFERAEAERLEAERLEAERIAAEQAEAARLEAERLAAEQAEAERLEAERIAAEQAEAERLAAERLEAERLEAER
ncbi:MAG TPA: Hpt domain-containing protein, partial [Xanthomonadaceae bacterium]|nr:Hpt domain-containing protein [Xanthomonadaceae bacterium]